MRQGLWARLTAKVGLLRYGGAGLGDYRRTRLSAKVGPFRDRGARTLRLDGTRLTVKAGPLRQKLGKGSEPRWTRLTDKAGQDSTTRRDETQRLHKMDCAQIREMQIGLAG